MFRVLNAAPSPSASQLRAIDLLKEERARRYEKRQESFDRCDTDGFVSQWADGLFGNLCEERIRILEKGGYAEFPVIVTETGQVVADRVFSFPNPKAHWITNYSWRVHDNYVESLGRKWLPAYNENSRILKQLKLHEEKRWFPAWAVIEGRGKGLSGSAWAQVYRLFSEKDIKEARESGYVSIEHY